MKFFEQQLRILIKEMIFKEMHPYRDHNFKSSRIPDVTLAGVIYKSMEKIAKEFIYPLIGDYTLGDVNRLVELFYKKAPELHKLVLKSGYQEKDLRKLADGVLANLSFNKGNFEE